MAGQMGPREMRELIRAVVDEAVSRAVERLAHVYGEAWQIPEGATASLDHTPGEINGGSSLFERTALELIRTAQRKPKRKR